uniref:Glycosyltransferase family 1 protein n=1 Tax=Fervidicoccus fontis TaxID=683846 RepID=A0A7J3SLL2_9CREN
MRIAIVCSYYPWPPSIGGVETIVQNVSTELAKRGHEVYVVTTPFDVTTMKQVSEYGMEERDRVIVYKLKPGRLRIGYARSLKGLKETLKEIRPEIVHEHNLHPHLFQLAKWKDSAGYRLVAELHHPGVNLDFLAQKILLPFVTYWLEKESTNIDVFLAHTRLEKSWLVSKGIKEDLIEVIEPPLISSKLFLRQPKELSNSDHLLYVGRVVPKKGLHVLLRALSLVNDTELVIAGPYEKRYFEKLQRLTAKLRLEDRVKFKGKVTEEEKIDLMSSCSVLVCPTLADYHPIVLLEAQALGVPVIATRVGAIPEIVVNGETGLLVEPNNELELAKAIETLLNNNALRLGFSRKAKEFAKNFTVEKAMEKLEMLYRNVLG